MQKELKQKIMGLPTLRTVDANPAELAAIGDGEPELLEEMFPFDEVPQVFFKGKVIEEIDGDMVEFDFDERRKAPLIISDTTFRDGQQARPPYTPEQMVDIYRLMGRLSGPNKVIANSEFFLYSDSDIRTLEACLDVYAEHPTYPEPTAWIRGLQDDALYLKLMQHMGVKETGLLSSCSDYHIFLKLKKNWRTAAEEYLTMAKMAAEREIRVRFHLEDITRANMDGFVFPFVTMIARFADELPEELKPKIRLCDTMGFGLPFPGVELPRSVPKLVHKVNSLGIPSSRLEWHGHNDFHLVIANGVAAWLCGCDILNGTLLGYGERTGNPPIEGAIVMYRALKGANGTDMRVIKEIADYFTELGAPIPPHQPFVGADANRTRAGIHGHGLSMDERIYQIFNTAKLLGIPPSITITDKSGMQGVEFWAKCYLAGPDMDRDDIALKKTKLVGVAKWVDYQYEELGRTTGISDDEMVSQLLLHLPDKCVPAYVNKAHRLTGPRRVREKDCAPIIDWIAAERKRRKNAAKAGDGAPPAGISHEAMEKLMAEHLPALYE